MDRHHLLQNPPNLLARYRNQSASSPGQTFPALSSDETLTWFLNSLSLQLLPDQLSISSIFIQIFNISLFAFQLHAKLCYANRVSVEMIKWIFLKKMTLESL